MVEQNPAVGQPSSPKEIYNSSLTVKAAAVDTEISTKNQYGLTPTGPTCLHLHRYHSGPEREKETTVSHCEDHNINHPGLFLKSFDLVG